MASNIVPVVIEDEAFNGTVVNNLNGIVFKTEEEYLIAMENLIKNKKLRKSLAIQARIQSEHLSSNQYASNVLVVYERAIKNRNKYQYGIFSKIASVFKENKK